MNTAGKKRVHKLTLTVTFDKPCLQGWAVGEVSESIHGTYYTDQRFSEQHVKGTWPNEESTDPGEFKIKSITRSK